MGHLCSVCLLFACASLGYVILVFPAISCSLLAASNFYHCTKCSVTRRRRCCEPEKCGARSLAFGVIEQSRFIHGRIGLKGHRQASRRTIPNASPTHRSSRYKQEGSITAVTKYRSSGNLGERTSGTGMRPVTCRLNYVSTPRFTTPP